MKKLMLTAAAVALAGVATAGNVYDYKASVKYVDFKSVTVAKVQYDVKVVKSTAITGYYVTPTDCACTTGVASGVKPGFLVVTTPLAKKWATDSNVRLIPGNLLVDWWAQKAITGKKVALQAQGYLFAGYGVNDIPQPGDKSPVYGFGDTQDGAEVETCATEFLFGEANTYDTDDTQDPVVNLFIEPFLDAAGFGTAVYGDDSSASICGKKSGGQTICLVNLAGSVIGGAWTCLGNQLGEGWLCQGWDSAQTANTVDAIDYTGCDFLYNVVSGTWSIKTNAKIGKATLSAAEKTIWDGTTGYEDQVALVKACGLKLDKDFDLTTFDEDGAAPQAFINKWMK